MMDPIKAPAEQRDVMSSFSPELVSWLSRFVPRYTRTAEIIPKEH